LYWIALSEQELSAKTANPVVRGRESRLIKVPALKKPFRISIDRRLLCTATEPIKNPLQAPAYSFWLNQVELWFAKIQRDVIDRGVFTSVADLARKLRRYIRAYEKTARPVRCDLH
jgi:hypothetical protein